jgi:DNA modification methylase
MTFFVKEHKCNFEFIIWAKSNVAPFCGGHYLKDKEYCLYFWETGAWLHGTYKTMKTIYETAENVADKQLYGHPTIKPQWIIENFIVNSSGEGCSVLDPFSGSGTTCAAAKKLGRHYMGFEIDKGYWQSSIDRLNGISQIDKKKIEDGQQVLF